MMALESSDGDDTTRRSRVPYRSTPESEARLLLLIDTFSRKSDGMPRYLEGRVKLAKLDFFLRYPQHLYRVLAARGVAGKDLDAIDRDDAPLEARMMRFRYGPWDPAYYAILGSLIGRGLVELAPLPSANGFGYRTTDVGAVLAERILSDASFAHLQIRLRILRRHLDKAGSTLKKYLYELPEVADATWYEEVE